LYFFYPAMPEAALTPDRRIRPVYARFPLPLMSPRPLPTTCQADSQPDFSLL
jgi:hypothetical protein